MSAVNLSIAILASLYSLRVFESRLCTEESPYVSLAYYPLSSKWPCEPGVQLALWPKLAITSRPLLQTWDTQLGIQGRNRILIEPEVVIISWERKVPSSPLIIRQILIDTRP
jgi:hypothetical protein